MKRAVPMRGGTVIENASGAGRSSGLNIPVRNSVIETVRNIIGKPLVERSTMKNVELEVKDDVLTITVDLSKEQGPSKSGKTIVIATTEGNQTVPGHADQRIGLNVYKYR